MRTHGRGILEEKARALHFVCEFNETAEPTRPSYALPATLKSERLESDAKRLRNDRVCPVRDTWVTERVDPETPN
jgi:hypothetical protein